MARVRKIKAADKPPLPAVTKHGGRLWPLTPYDGELLEEIPDGTEFTLVITNKAQSRQQRKYWKVLRGVCEATGMWPRAQELHGFLKLATGYVTPGIDILSGQPVTIPSSTALDSMTHGEFLTYYRAAMAALEQRVGFDPEEVLRP